MGIPLKVIYSFFPGKEFKPCARKNDKVYFVTLIVKEKYTFFILSPVLFF